jgi:hypothetical protein
LKQHSVLLNITYSPVNMADQTRLGVYGNNDRVMDLPLEVSPDKPIEILELEEDISERGKPRSPLRLTAIMTALYVRFYPLPSDSIN